MNISEQNWENIKRFFGDSSHVSASPVVPYCAFATVNKDGSPRVAPYTSLILGEYKQGIYFDQLSQQMSCNLEHDQRICILLVKRSAWFFIKSILLGRYDHPPGIRLSGRVGNKRKATNQEINAYRKPIRFLKVFKGFKSSWGVMKHVREIHFDSYEKVECGIKEVESI